MTDRERVDEWNRLYDDGIAVDVRRDDGSVLRTVTYTGASLLGGHTAVIFVAGISGCYALDRVTPVEPCDEENLEYTRAGGDATCKCGGRLRDHPMDLNHIGYDRRPFLHVLCDGRLVKL